MTFGVSGLLYKNNLLMYDRQTESLWLQVKREAVTGPLTGQKLIKFSSTITTWEKWKTRYPQTLVLSMDTGYSRDYSKDPYEAYYKNNHGFFSFLRSDEKNDDKTLVAGITIEGQSRAYILDDLKSRKTLQDNLGSKIITIKFDQQTDTVVVSTADGKALSHVITYLFVWRGIYPDTGIYKKTP